MHFFLLPNVSGLKVTQDKYIYIFKRNILVLGPIFLLLLQLLEESSVEIWLL